MRDNFKNILQSLIIWVGQALGFLSSFTISAQSQAVGFPEDHITASQWFFHILFLCANGILTGAIISSCLFVGGIVVVRLGYKDWVKSRLHKLIDKWDKDDKKELQ